MISFNNIGRYGRLGNQMFQYATLYGVAKELGYDFGVPYETNQEFELPKVFNLSANDSSKTTQERVFAEKRHDFDPDIFLIEGGTDIFGYFQTEKYFKKYSDEIKKEYQFPEKISNYCNTYKKTLSEEKIISLHVRRGDYVSCPENHPTCSINFYKEAMNHFGNGSCFLVFSDDIQWCMKNLSGDNLKFFNHNHFYDLCMMSLCDGHIIANSSYSWWGAWLGNREHVVAPAKWFGEALSYKNVEDVYCENWIVI